VKNAEISSTQRLHVTARQAEKEEAYQRLFIKGPKAHRKRKIESKHKTHREKCWDGVRCIRYRNSHQKHSTGENFPRARPRGYRKIEERDVREKKPKKKINSRGRVSRRQKTYAVKSEPSSKRTGIGGDRNSRSCERRRHWSGLEGEKSHRLLPEASKKTKECRRI